LLSRHFERWGRPMTNVIVGSSGDPCPRCGRATEIREHRYITAKELRRPFHYSRWFFCRNPRCKTSTIVLPEYRVFNAVTNAVTPETERRMAQIAEQLGLPSSAQALDCGRHTNVRISSYKL
jgi:hypothetical protein